jgi:hypothetical protein
VTAARRSGRLPSRIAAIALLARSRIRRTSSVAVADKAFGWDPFHAMDGVRAPADVVNLGFVLNVIEDQRERLETLKAAWGFAQQALCVAVMRYGKVSTVPGVGLVAALSFKVGVDDLRPLCDHER